MRALREIGAALWHDLRGTRARALLSVLSVAWGTLAILCLLAFSFGFEELFQRRQAGIGEAVVIAWPQRTTQPWQGFPSGRRVRVHRADVRALPASVPGVLATSSEFFASEVVRDGSKLLRISLAGVDEDYGLLRSLTPQHPGRWLNARDLAERRRVLFLGDRLARELFGAAEPVGRRVVLRGASFLVVGILQPKEQDSDYGGPDEGRAFLPATAFLDLYGAQPVNDFVFRARDPHAQNEVTTQVVAALGRRVGFAPGDRSALLVWDTTEETRMLGWIFLGFHVVLGIAGVVTVLLGGVAVGHLMAFLVRRRTAEIGLKLAIGATPRAVLREVLAQAAVLVAAGAALGAGAAGLVLLAVAQTPAVEQVGTPFVPPPIALGAASLLAAVGLAAGWFPARAAARLDPVAALREGAH
jgi:putative ABC transport system permease protein